MTWIHVGYSPTQTHPDSPPTAEFLGRQSNSRRQRPCPPSRKPVAQAVSLAPQRSMCSTESREDADLPLGRSALASHACTHLILGPHGSFDGSTRNEQPSACGYSCPHDPIAGGPAHPDKQALWTRHQARVGLRIDPRAATVSLPRQRRFPPKQHRVAPHTRHYTRSVCSTPFLFRCAAPDQVRCSRSGAVPARRHRQAAEALCASVLESARAQASAGVRDRSALSPIDRTARPRRHLPSAREASRQSLQPGYETPPPSG